MVRCACAQAGCPAGMERTALQCRTHLGSVSVQMAPMARPRDADRPAFHLAPRTGWLNGGLTPMVWCFSKAAGTCEHSAVALWATGRVRHRLAHCPWLHRLRWRRAQLPDARWQLALSPAPTASAGSTSMWSRAASGSGGWWVPTAMLHCEAQAAVSCAACACVGRRAASGGTTMLCKAIDAPSRKCQQCCRCGAMP